MIENFSPQPYPLECSADGATWSLVIGWTTIGDGRVGADTLVPVTAHPSGGLADVVTTADLAYRPADTRPPRAPATTARSARPTA